MFFKGLASVLFRSRPGTAPVRPGTVLDGIGSDLGRPTSDIGDTSGTSPGNSKTTSGPQPTEYQLTGEQAVRAFLVEMMEWVAGDELPFREVALNYKALSQVGAGLAPMSDKALSQYLVGMGCTRRKVHRNGARPTLIKFPEYIENVVPLRRAAAA